MDDAEFFLPSEIARLVYGHFKAMECDDLSTKFLNESTDLAECRELKMRNRSFKTEANGLPLKDILDQYLNMNKLILGTVNKLVGDQQKFSDPVEAFNYLLGSVPEEKQTCTNVSIENQDSSESDSSSSSEDMFSDFSLNLKTPEKHKSREKVTKNKSDTVIDLNSIIDRLAQETTPETNKPESRLSSEVIIRQSSRLQLKNALKNCRSCNSDSIKDLRLNPNDDCKTPRKVGNPPYSENKLLKPKTPISLLSSDSESETSIDRELSVTNIPNSSSAITERCNGLFSPERPKSHTVKKKTLKVMRPRRPPSASVSVISDEQSCENDKTKCKRNRGSTLPNMNNTDNENKKSKLSSDVCQQQKETRYEEKTQRSSDEFVFTAEVQQTDEKQKLRRKSGSMIPINNEKSTPIKFNKSLPMLDDMLLQKKLIKNVKLTEHIAANVNEITNIINSPQKKANESDHLDLDELIKTSIERIVDDPSYKKFESDVLVDLMLGGDFISGQTSSDINSVTEFTGKEITTSTMHDQLQLNNQVTISTPITGIEDPLVNNTGVESHHEKQNPAIIIKIRDDQIVNQDNYVEKTNTVSEELRNYWSNVSGLEPSPDGKLNLGTSDHTSVINIMNPDGGISESCKIGNDIPRRLVLNSDTYLIPINEGINMVTIAKGSEFQICGNPAPISQINPQKPKYVNIRPKSDVAIQMPDKAICNFELNKVSKRGRTRGGKRS